MQALSSIYYVKIELSSLNIQNFTDLCIESRGTSGKDLQHKFNSMRTKKAKLSVCSNIHSKMSRKQSNLPSATLISMKSTSTIWLRSHLSYKMNRYTFVKKCLSNRLRKDLFIYWPLLRSSKTTNKKRNYLTKICFLLKIDLLSLKSQLFCWLQECIQGKLHLPMPCRV